MEWSYGKLMYEQEDIKSMDEWSDDKEMTCKIMDEKFDYMWDFSNGIRFIDRLYSSGVCDDTVKMRVANNEANMTFENFAEVFKWIISHSKGNEEYLQWMNNRIA